MSFADVINFLMKTSLTNDITRKHCDFIFFFWILHNMKLFLTLILLKIIKRKQIYERLQQILSCKFTPNSRGILLEISNLGWEISDDIGLVASPECQNPFLSENPSEAVPDASVRHRQVPPSHKLPLVLKQELHPLHGRGPALGHHRGGPAHEEVRSHLLRRRRRRRHHGSVGGRPHLALCVTNFPSHAVTKYGIGSGGN